MSKGNQHIGGQLSGISRRLRALGVSDEHIRAAFRGGREAKKVRITARTKASVAKLLVNEGDKCILLMSKSGKVRVYSMQGYETTISNAKMGTAALARKHAARRTPTENLGALA